MTGVPSSMDLKLHLSETAHFFLLDCPGHLSGNELKEDLILHSLLAVLTCATLKQPAVARVRLKTPQTFGSVFSWNF